MVQMLTVNSLRDLNKVVNQSAGEEATFFQINGDDLGLFITIRGLDVTIQDSLFTVEESFQSLKDVRDYIAEMFNWELE